MKKKVGKSQTATLTSEEIQNALEGDVGKAAGKVYDHYKGKTFAKKHEGSSAFGNPLINTVDKNIDPYKGIRQTKKDENSSAFGEPLINTVAFDKKNYDESQSDE